MSQRILILIAGILAGAAVVFLITKPSSRPVDPVPAEVSAADYQPPPHTSSAAEAPAAPPRETMPRPAVTPTAPALAPVSAWARLAEKYGPEKTATSSKITSNITSVIRQGMELANAAATNSGSATVAEAATKEILRGASRQLGLSDEQKQQASGIIQNSVNKRMAAVNDLTSAMGSEPEQIMELLLAGDALARKEITRQQYDTITQPTRAMLQNLTGYITGQPGQNAASQLMMDEETMSQINAILTPEQQTKLSEMTASLAQRVAARQAAAMTNNSTFFEPGQIPIMELGQMDQAVASMRQMTEAARMMMEAMKGMKDAQKPPTNP